MYKYSDLKKESKITIMNYHQAEILAIQGLSYLAAREDKLLGYFKLSGISPEELRKLMADPSSQANILGSILDYFLQNEKSLIEFSSSEQIPPEQIAIARRLLPGGETTPTSI